MRLLPRQLRRAMTEKPNIICTLPKNNCISDFRRTCPERDTCFLADRSPFRSPARGPRTPFLPARSGKSLGQAFARLGGLPQGPRAVAGRLGACRGSSPVACTHAQSSEPNAHSLWRYAMHDGRNRATLKLVISPLAWAFRLHGSF
jgi:hypothetical protein